MSATVQVATDIYINTTKSFFLPQSGPTVQIWHYHMYVISFGTTKCHTNHLTNMMEKSSQSISWENTSSLKRKPSPRQRCATIVLMACLFFISWPLIMHMHIAYNWCLIPSVSVPLIHIPTLLLHVTHKFIISFLFSFDMIKQAIWLLIIRMLTK